MSGVPQRVRDEAAAADAELQRLASPEQPPSEQPPSEQPPAPAPSKQPPSEQPPAPAPSEQPPAPPQAPAAPIDQAEVTKLLQAHRTLQGMYNAQNTQMAELRGRVEQMSRQAPAPAPAAPAAPPAPARMVSEEEIKDFGPELISVIKRAAKEDLLPSINNMSRRLEVLEGRIGQVATSAQQAQQVAEQSAEDRFWSTLESRIPNVGQINTSQEFLDWLEIPDMFSGVKRLALLQRAYSNFDADRVGLIFDAFLREQTTPPDGGNGFVPPPAPPSVIDPRTLIAPGNAAGAPSASQPGARGRIWTTPEVNKVYDDHMQKRTTPEQFAADEAAIMQAMSEGRIRD